MKRVALTFVLILLCAATAAAQFSFVLTERVGGKSSTAKGFADGAKFRLEPQQSTADDDPHGMYVISVDGGRIVYMVNPERQEFGRIDTHTLMAKAAEELKARMKEATLQFESPKVATLLAEAGETIEGHPTRHYKLRISYTLHYLKNDLSSSYVEYQDLWMATDIEQEGATNLLIYFRPSGDPRIDLAWQHEVAQIRGFPLRQVTLRTEVNEEGNSRVARITREMTHVQTGAVPASLFVLPTGYKEVQLKESIY